MNYKESQFEDCERDKSRILKQMSEQKEKYNDLKSLNEVIAMVENSSKNFEWANKVRKTELPGRQAEIFYQTYLI